MATLGTMLMMLKGEIAEQGMFPILQRVSDIGFKAVEVSQVPMDEANVGGLEKAKNELGLEVGAISVALKKAPYPAIDALDTDWDKIISDASRLGTRYARVGMMPLEAMSSLPALEEYCAELDEGAARLAAEGITLCYHNHHVDLAKYDGERIFDIVRRLAPNARFEIDLHWVQRGGANPVQVLKDYAGFVDLIHLKDYAIATLDPAALKARASGDMDAWQRLWNGVVRFAPVGDGNMDWPAILAQAVESGTSYMFVEQDDLYGADVWECITRSYEHVKRLGYAS
ncbi:MAG TPA: sugar phosphate isomerase/epimerase [Propionibacteriaceae bacterium]|nr:sugar phosphate isomerase/epimerase [Propionibacteriaceae bacterium]HQE30692.1 sugar phosphate isomerase/epimerase [Propionibacteriaceae bacterium]